jgi:hypothetical protein
MESAPLLAGEGLQNIAHARRSGPMSRSDLYRATHAVKRGLGFSDLIRRTALLSRFLRMQWDADTYVNPDSHGSTFSRLLRHAPVMICVRIDLPHTLVCRKRRLNVIFQIQKIF